MTAAVQMGGLRATTADGQQRSTDGEGLGRAEAPVAATKISLNCPPLDSALSFVLAGGPWSRLRAAGVEHLISTSTPTARRGADRGGYWLPCLFRRAGRTFFATGPVDAVIGTAPHGCDRGGHKPSESARPDADLFTTKGPTHDHP